MTEAAADLNHDRLLRVIIDGLRPANAPI